MYNIPFINSEFQYVLVKVLKSLKAFKAVETTCVESVTESEKTIQTERQT